MHRFYYKYQNWVIFAINVKSNVNYKMKNIETEWCLQSLKNTVQPFVLCLNIGSSWFLLRRCWILHKLCKSLTFIFWQLIWSLKRWQSVHLMLFNTEDIMFISFFKDNHLLMCIFLDIFSHIVYSSFSLGLLLNTLCWT